MTKLQLFTLILVFVNLLAFGQDVTLTGTVYDAETNQPLPGATVIIKDTTEGTTSDFDGVYSIRVAVGKTLSFSEFTSQISKELGVKAPQKTAKRWMLSIAWRFDWLNHKIIGKKRKLTKNMCRTLDTKNYYSSDKFLKLEKDYMFTSMSKTISEVSQIFLKDLKHS